MMLCHIGLPIRLSDDMRAREKSFEIGQKVLVLTPDSTSSKTFSRLIGPAVVKDKLSNHSYLLDINGAVKHIHFMLTRSENITYRSMRSFVTQSH